MLLRGKVSLSIKFETNDSSEVSFLRMSGKKYFKNLIFNSIQGKNIIFLGGTYYRDVLKKR